MMLVIENLLERSKLDRVRSVLCDATYSDGKDTAGESAKLVKNNLQAVATTPGETNALLECKQLIATALVKSNLVQAWARPKAIIEINFAKYEAGHEYGWHVDNPLMNGLRTDLAFTLFLSDGYVGGNHIIDGDLQQRVLQQRALDINSIMIYPAGTRHMVSPVASGTRLVAAGWMQSYVRDPAKREVLYDLDCIANKLRGDLEEGDLDILAKTAMNLERMWTE